MIYFTADTHYGHAKILDYCDRPFSDVVEMNEQLIKNHNAVVSPKDTVYFLGDFAFSKFCDTNSILKRLNGKKFILLGNHDRAENYEREEYAKFLGPYYELYVQDSTAHKGSKLVVLMHYAMRVWNKSHYGSWHLYGHCHNKLPEDPNSLSFDVGVDAIARRYSVGGVLNPKDYRPISYDEVKTIMENK